MYTTANNSFQPFFYLHFHFSTETVQLIREKQESTKRGSFSSTRMQNVYVTLLPERAWKHAHTYSKRKKIVKRIISTFLICYRRALSVTFYSLSVLTKKTKVIIAKAGYRDFTRLNCRRPSPPPLLLLYMALITHLSPTVS